MGPRPDDRAPLGEKEGVCLPEHLLLCHLQAGKVRLLFVIAGRTEGQYTATLFTNTLLYITTQHKYHTTTLRVETTTHRTSDFTCRRQCNTAVFGCFNTKAQTKLVGHIAAIPESQEVPHQARCTLHNEARFVNCYPPQACPQHTRITLLR